MMDPITYPHTIFVTGGAGFIGSHLIRFLLSQTTTTIINIDQLTYAGNLSSLQDTIDHPRHIFIRTNINDYKEIDGLFLQYKPSAIINLAAESHVDKGIDHPDSFMQTNIMGTYQLLQASLRYWGGLSRQKKSIFRFHQISTDEVFGDMYQNDHTSSEHTPYFPSSPYSASKASADHLVRAWNRTYGLPILISISCNNYGPFQMPEKFIPRSILCALRGLPISIYGSGEQVRDWLHVEDHVRALWAVLNKGEVGQTYNISAHHTMSNIDLLHMLCGQLEELYPCQKNTNTAHLNHYTDLIQHTTDRPGHDTRYALNAQKIMTQLHWKPEKKITQGLQETISWFINNTNWWEELITNQPLTLRQGRSEAMLDSKR